MSEQEMKPSGSDPKPDDGLLRDLAWAKYADLDSAEYAKEHQELQGPEHVTPLVYHYGDRELTLVASRNIGPNGEPLGNHDYNPDSPYHADLDRVFDHYLDTTKAEERVGIVEGSIVDTTDRDEAIRQGTESGQLAAVAHSHDMPVISAEPTNAELHQELYAEGVTSIELAALYSVWSLGGLARREGGLDHLGAHLATKAAEAEATDVRLYTPEEQAAMTPEQRDLVLAELDAKGAELVPQLNEALSHDWFGLKDGRVSLNLPDEVLGDPPQMERALADAWWPDRPGRINEVSRLTADLRDKHLFGVILDQLKDGKSPIVPFGSTHIARLKPCFDTYLGQEPSKLDVTTL